MRSTRLALLTFILSLGGLACGDTDDSNGDGPMCGAFDACGGKLEGSWKLEDACYVVLEQPKLGFCDEATAELQARMTEGSITFEDDTFERNYEIETELILNIPESCRGDKECIAMGDTLDNGATLVCGNADGEKSGCACSALFTSRTSQSGEFTIRGNRVQLVGEELGYCVKGDTLTLRPTSTINMSGSNATSILQTTFSRN